MTAQEAKAILLRLEGVESGSAYGYPSLMLARKFFARLRDHDAVLVLQLGSIEERDVLMGLDPSAFFFTEHYRDYPAVLIRLAAVRKNLLEEVIVTAHGALLNQRGRAGRTTAHSASGVRPGRKIRKGRPH